MVATSRLGMTLNKEIGHQCGLTSERVRQIVICIMNKLRTIAKTHDPELPARKARSNAAPNFASGTSG